MSLSDHTSNLLRNYEYPPEPPKNPDIDEAREELHRRVHAYLCEQCSRYKTNIRKIVVDDLLCEPCNHLDDESDDPYNISLGLMRDREHGVHKSNSTFFVAPEDVGDIINSMPLMYREAIAELLVEEYVCDTSDDDGEIDPISDDEVNSWSEELADIQGEYIHDTDGYDNNFEGTGFNEDDEDDEDCRYLSEYSREERQRILASPQLKALYLSVLAGQYQYYSPEYLEELEELTTAKAAFAANAIEMLDPAKLTRDQQRLLTMAGPDDVAVNIMPIGRNQHQISCIMAKQLHPELPITSLDIADDIATEAFLKLETAQAISLGEDMIRRFNEAYEERARQKNIDPAKYQALLQRQASDIRHWIAEETQ